MISKPKVTAEGLLNPALDAKAARSGPSRKHSVDNVPKGTIPFAL
jgi:hypothetical protein